MREQPIRVQQFHAARRRERDVQEARDLRALAVRVSAREEQDDLRREGVARLRREVPFRVEHTNASRS